MALSIEIRDQPSLGISKTSAICFSGIYHRLFRSLVTIMVISLASAFFVMVLGNGLHDRRIWSVIEDRMQDEVRLARWMGWLTVPMDEGQLRLIMTTSERADQQSELLQWAELREDQVAELKEVLLLESRMIDFLDHLPVGRRRALVGGRGSTQALDWIKTAEGLEAFKDRLQALKAVYLPDGLDGLRQMVDQARATAETRARLLEGHARSIRMLAEEAPRPVVEILLDEPASLAPQLHDLGFVAERDELERLTQAQQRRDDKQAVAAAVLNPDMRRILSRRLRLDYMLVTPRNTTGLLIKEAGATWFLEQTAETGIDLDLTAQEIMAIATSFRWEQWRDRAATRLGTLDDSFWGLGQRTGWLVLVSLLVCTVGIANAMLMSVTERFREIATMKCLGAGDGAIMGLFIMESCVMGLAGGILGALLGVGITLLRGLLSFGFLALQALPFEAFAFVGLAALGYGIFLAGAAAVYPALVAARLAPMEAMRIE